MHAWLADRSVVLVGGSSSVGKTTLARALAERVDGEHVSVDDLRCGVDDPRVRFFAETEEPWRLYPSALCLVLRHAAEAMRPHLGRVVDDALSARHRLVLEGEALDPELAARYSSDPRVCALFVTEFDSDRLMETLDRRSPPFRLLAASERLTVARTCALYGRWLAGETARHGLPCISSQPWATLSDRALRTVEQAEFAS